MERRATALVDCLSCQDRACLRGEPCAIEHLGAHEIGDQRVLESAMDIALERERILCRLSELVYFCLEMRFRRVGLAFCVDLLEPSRILAGVLRHPGLVKLWLRWNGGSGSLHAGEYRFEEAPGPVTVYGLDGDDTIIVDPAITNDFVIYAGAGNFGTPSGWAISKSDPWSSSHFYRV